MTNIANQSQPQAAQPNPIRASDADRDRVAQVLTDALADGRIDQNEHSERLEAVYSAKTLGELAPITSDLESVPTASSAASSVEGLTASPNGMENIAAVFGSAERSGRWLVEPRTNVSTLFGSVSLDLREAVLSQHEVVIQCGVVFGELKITVPPGVRVLNETKTVFGESNFKKADPATAVDAPTVRLTGTLIFGSVNVKTLAPGAKKKPWWSC